MSGVTASGLLRLLLAGTLAVAGAATGQAPATGAATGAALTPAAATGQAPGPPAASSPAAVPLTEIRHLLREQALVAPTEQQLAALNAANLEVGLAALDPAARYFPAGAYRAPNLGRERPSGIGAELLIDPAGVRLMPLQGAAAAQAGVPERARLIAIDGRRVAGLTPERIAEALRGPPGSRVTLDLEDLQGRRLSRQVERATVKALDVELVQPGNRQVLRIRELTSGLTRPALLATLEFMDRGPPLARPGQQARAPLIIDLRDATGGDLFEAFDLAALFLPEGTPLGSLVDRDGTPRQFRAPAGTPLTMPLTLLIGPGTASAAEILAGILQDHARARLVGQRTFGKCSSQTDVRLSDGSVLRFTNREVLLPRGASCSGGGVVPDVQVDSARLADLASLVRQLPAPTDEGGEVKDDRHRTPN